MGDDHQGAPPLGLVLPEDREDLVAGPRVQLAGRLVRQDEARGLDQGPRDRHPLLLAAGELVRAVTQALGQAHPAQHIDRLSPELGRTAVRQVGQEDVVDGREVPDQVE